VQLPNRKDYVNMPWHFYWRGYMTEALKAAFSAIIACIPIG
jgi:hypothetical protein